MSTLSLDCLTNKWAKPRTYVRLSVPQRGRLLRLGEAVYGDEWKQLSAQRAKKVSGGIYATTNELTPHYADVLIRQLEVELKDVQP